RAVRLEVLVVRVLDRVVPLEPAEVGDHRPAAVVVDADHAVGYPGDSVRAARPRQQGVHAMADEGHAGDTADEAAQRRAGLARRQRLDDRGDVTAGRHLRDAPAQERVVGTARVRRGRTRSLAALTDGGVRPTEATLGNVE